MKIALDYDDTYTQDPLLWNWFVQQAQDRGHEVFCVTARDEKNLDDVTFTLGRLLPPGHVIACGHKPKRGVTQSLGIKIDVWIDDMPEMVGELPLLRGLQ
jgi:hypothetical protein